MILKSSIAQTSFGSDQNEKTQNLNRRFAPDAAGFALTYFDPDNNQNGDYNPIGNFTTDELPFIEYDNNLGSETVPGGTEALHANLYNGNIARMTTSLHNSNQVHMGAVSQNYRYDQANRIKYMTDLQFTDPLNPDEDLLVENNTYAGINISQFAADNYFSTYKYDKNGNITDLKRNGYSAQSLNMDDLTYYYVDQNNNVSTTGYNTNKLNYVADAHGQTYTNDFPGQSAYNFDYDAIGNLIKDESEEIEKIEWTVSGKVKAIIRTATSERPDLEFRYDPMGNRTAKIEIPYNGSTSNRKYTRYARDAQGNTMATYTRTGVEEAELKELVLYGSQRLGTLTQKSSTNEMISALLCVGDLPLNFNLFVNGSLIPGGVFNPYNGNPESIISVLENAGYKVEIEENEEEETCLRIYGELNENLIFAVEETQPESQGLDMNHSAITQQQRAGSGAAAYGHKQYEISNHLGNVLSTVSDKKIYTGLIQTYSETFEETPNPGWTVRHTVQPGTPTNTPNPVSSNALVIEPAATTGVSNSSVTAFSGAISVQPSTTYQVDIDMYNTDPDLVQNFTAYARDVNAPYDLQHSNRSVPIGPNQINHRFTFTTGAATQQVELWFYVQSPVLNAYHNGTDILKNIEPFKILVNQISMSEITNYQGFTADVQTSTMYYPFGMQMPGRMYNSDDYVYGFGGMYKDDEIKGSGNHINYEARGYDTRLGKWWSVDPQTNKQPGWSTYKYGFNNPIIFIDPDGETEFYYNGKWIGTDGQDNNLIAVVKDRKLKRKIKKTTRKGLNYTKQSTDEAVESSNNMLLINRDVLLYAYKMLEHSLSQEGEEGEYGNTMVQIGDKFYITGEMLYQEGSSVTLPDFGGLIEMMDVSIHSHPTGLLDEEGRYSSAEEPSEDERGNPGDESAFKKFKTNIIVGKNGSVKIRTNSETGRKSFDESGRYPAINFFDNNSDRTGTIGGKEANKMIKGDRGNLGRKFEQKSQSED